MTRLNILANSNEISITRPYFERVEVEKAWHDKTADILVALFISPLSRRLLNAPIVLQKIVALTNLHDQIHSAASDRELKDLARKMRGRLRRKGFTKKLVGECFSLVREAASRSLGRRHYDSQIIAGWSLLQGKLAEMATGEGKTFAATLPAAVVALADYPVHVITVNDYLAERDADSMSPLYEFLGLSVGHVVQGMSKPERRTAYRQAITYCTNKELAFDYLKDGVVLAQRSSGLHLALESLRGDNSRDAQLVLRGLYFAIVDEADSVFIDEARTPLILSASVGQSDALDNNILALALARTLKIQDDYVLDLKERKILLSDQGVNKLEAYVEANELAGLWRSTRAREELCIQALSALHLYKKDLHYVVTEGRVQIVDESTGRVMPDRSWEQGLHQLIEAKEECELTETKETLARLTYQRLFRRYIRLCGMTGTAREVTKEIKATYQLDVAYIPLNKPCKRSYEPTTVCSTLEQKWQHVANRVQQLALVQGRPVLIGTRSVQASEEISTVLNLRAIEHSLLNAKQDAVEAEIIADAGIKGRVTVATNIAGRGTDILLGEGVSELGGLHVMLTEYHDSQRVDRQLYGRCARQGDPGSCEAILSLEDEIFATYAPATTAFCKRFKARWARLPKSFFWILKTMVQYTAESKSRQLRIQTMHVDDRLNKVLAFSGRGE